MRSTRSRTLLALAAVGALVVAGCSSDDEGSDTATDTPTDTGSETVLSVPAAPTAPTAPDATGVPPSTATGDTGPGDTAPTGTETGGTGATGSEADYVAAFGANYAVFDDEADNECVGQAIVDAVGLEAIESSGTAPDDVIGIVFLSEAGLVIDDSALDAAIAQLADCGDLAAVAIEGGSGTEEQTDCAADVVTSELAAEQLLTQIGELDPSPALDAARDELDACLEL
jgi:hypothetical protein